jgi:UDP-N-acetylmuramate: L-alanyl-gamma-D-glutamyl-meso-diaminopimelate ligase
MSGPTRPGDAQAGAGATRPDAHRPFDPDALRRVHFVAIGGTGMGSLAGLVKARGVLVTGSDKKLYPPMSTALEDWGIAVREGFDPGHLDPVPAEAGGEPLAPDLVVIGNAVRADNPEALAAIASGVPYRSFSDALYELAIRGRHCITVSGTHGKTTTTALAAHLLMATGRDPSLLVGGISLDFGGSFREGAGEHFVVEGDEYDTAFFDKTPKFLHYHPDTLILTSVEFDHADIYRDLEHVKSAFRELVSTRPPGARIVAALGHAGVRDVIRDAPCAVVGYGAEREAGESPPTGVRWWGRDPSPGEGGLRFTLEDLAEGRSYPVTSPLFGVHNVENVVAAVAALEGLGVPVDELLPALVTHRGVKRRQEVRGVAAGVTVIDDFAHHPTAVKGTIEAIAQRHRGGRVVALLEPRTNTSRRAIFQDAYVEALASADRVAIAEVADEPIYSATGEVTETLSAARVAAALRSLGRDAASFADVDAIVEWVVAGRRPGDVVLVMSNGAFGGIWEKLLSALQTEA